MFLFLFLLLVLDKIWRTYFVELNLFEFVHTDFDSEGPNLIRLWAQCAGNNLVY